MIEQRDAIRQKLSAFWRNPAAVTGLWAEDAVLDAAWPVNQLVGAQAILNQFVTPMRAALTGLYRRDLMFLGGVNNRAEQGNWCSCVTHYVGTFNAPLFGLQPSTKLVFLRAGEFYRIVDGQIAEAKIIFDLPDMMRQSGHLPLPSLGTELTFPAPATQDGLAPVGDGAASLALVERMLGDLHVFDPETGTSTGQTGSTGAWADNMMWYGPAGVGSNYEWDGFSKDHRMPFLHAFPDRKGGNHYCRFGDGDYACVSGWPSMTMTFVGDYLGHKATGQSLTLRVMDFYRIEANKIAENWVTLDYGDLFAQMGRDLVAEANTLIDAKAVGSHQP
ncbi:MAG: ester cyclase [Pseudomonadota bacterium]